MPSKSKVRALQQMSTEELKLSREDLEYDRRNFRLGLLKIHVALWGLILSLMTMFVLSALGHPGFMTGKYFVIIVAVSAAALVADLAFVYRRNVSIKAKLRAINAELTTR